MNSSKVAHCASWVPSFVAQPSGAWHQVTYGNPLPPSDAVRKQKKNILEDLFSSELSQFEKYRPSGNLKFYYLGIFQSLNLRILMEKNPSNLS